MLLNSLTVAEEDALIMATKMAEEEYDYFDFSEQSFLPDDLFEDFIYFLRKKDFSIGNFLSKGTFGSVFNCGEKFVIKLENDQGQNEPLLIPKNSRFVNVVESGIFHDMRYTIMEKLTPVEHDRKIYLDLVKAIRVLQASNIAHCDIKFDNVMSRNGRNVLIDFGFAKKIGTKLGNVTGTPFYMSLDALKKTITKRCDYESLCYMMLDMETVNGTLLPWDECCPFLDFEKLYQKKYNFMKAVTVRNPKILSTYKIPDWVVDFICEVRGGCDGRVLQKILETAF